MIETKLIIEEIKNGKISENVLKGVKEEIPKLLLETKRENIDGLIDYLEKTDFYSAPASTRFHGNYEGGLAVHSLLVYREFDALLDRYGSDLPAESRKIVGICHDLCKIGVYKKNELKKGNLSLVKPYNFDDEFPIGHGEKSLYLVRENILPTLKEALLIRWHMGTYDSNYQMNEDSIKTKCPELVILQSADRIVSGWYDI